MSQFWHSHWAEDAYKPGLLGNWQVPNWHPKWPCVRHCVTTTFLADRSGRLLPDKPRSKRSPWGDFKGTWELPLKIDRKLAQKLSAPPKYKLAAWKAHKIRYEGPCGITAVSPKATKKKPENQAKRRKSPAKSVERTRKSVARSKKTIDKNKVTIAKVKGKKARETIAKTKGTDPTSRRVLDKTDKAPQGNQLKAVVSKESSEAPEDDEKKTIAEEPEYEEEKIIIEEPESEDKKTTTEDTDYEDQTISEERPAENKIYREKHRKVERTECLCANKFDSHSLAEVPPKPMRNICIIHQRLRV